MDTRVRRRKTRELKSEELDRAPEQPVRARFAERRGFTRFVAATGRSMRRVGQRLESWARWRTPITCTSC